MGTPSTFQTLRENLIHNDLNNEHKKNIIKMAAMDNESCNTVIKNCRPISQVMSPLSTSILQCKELSYRVGRLLVFGVPPSLYLVHWPFKEAGVWMVK